MATTASGYYYPTSASVQDISVELAAMAASQEAVITAVPAGFGLWGNYTPSAVSGLVVVNGTLTGRYTQTGKTTRFIVKYVAGSSDTFSAGFVFSLPVSAATFVEFGVPLGDAWMFDSSAGSTSRRTGTTVRFAAGSFQVHADSLSTATQVTNAVPWTWATGDTLFMTGEYESV